jgi:hypothetical protein
VKHDSQRQGIVMQGRRRSADRPRHHTSLSSAPARLVCLISWTAPADGDAAASPTGPRWICWGWLIARSSERYTPTVPLLQATPLSRTCTSRPLCLLAALDDASGRRLRVTAMRLWARSLTCSQETALDCPRFSLRRRRTKARTPHQHQHRAGRPSSPYPRDTHMRLPLQALAPRPPNPSPS